MQNMMGVRGNGMGLQQRSTMPENNNPTGQIQKIIYQHLQQQPTQSGWWSAVSPQNRSAVVFHVVSSLRLIKPEITIQQAIEVALKFEREAFDKSQDKAAYEGACRAKIAEIADTRAKQATILQQRMQNSGGPSMQLLQQQQQQQQQNMAMNNAITSMQMQGQLPPGYQVPQQQMQPPHMQMQTTAQQSYPMNNGMVNNQPSMQQGQQIQSNPPAQGPPRAAQPQLTPEEHKQILELARRNAQAASPEEIEMIKQRMDRGVDARTRQIWLQQGVELHQAYYRQLAVKQFLNGKAKAQMQGTMAQAAGFNPQQSQPISRNPSSNQNQPPSQNNFDQSFPPSIQQNVHQILGLQQDALRKQDLGREVVPASSSQQQSQQARGFQVTPRQLPIQQPSANRSIPTPNTAQQQNIQAQQIQAARVQAAQTQNAIGPQGQPGQQTPLQGQLGGLSSHPGQGVSQPSPSMPNLNRPMQTTPQQPQAQGTPTQRPSQRVQDQKQGFETPSVQLTQVKQQEPSINNQSISAAQVDKLVSNLPPAAQAKYHSLPEQSRRQFLFQYYQLRQQHQQQQQRTSMMMSSQTSGPRGISSIPGQGMQSGRPQQHSSQQANASMFGLKSDLSMIQQPGQMIQHQSLTGMPNPFMSQMQGQGPQFGDIMQNQGQFQNRAPTLNQAQLRQMDTHPFPPGLFDTQLVGSRLPPEVKNWSQLKTWAAQNRHIVPNEVLQKLIGLQALHYHNIMQTKARDFRQAQAAMANSTSTPQPGPAPQAQMTQMGNLQQPRPNGPAGNPLPMARMPQVPPLSRQEIQLFRQKLPDQARNVSDEQVAQLIMRRRMAIMAGQAPQSLNPQQSNHLNEQQRRLLDYQTNQSNQISLGRSANQTTPSMQQNSRMPNTVLTPNRPAHNQPAQPGQQMMNQVQTSQKNLKRSSTDDVIEVPNPNITQQDQRNQTISKQGHPKQSLSQSENAAGKTGQISQNHEGQYEAELRTQAALKDQPRGQQQSKGTPQDNPQSSQIRSKFEDDAVRQRLHQITGEVVQLLKAQNRRPIAVDQATRQKMDKILKENQEVIKRSEESLSIYLKIMRDENLVRDLVGTRILIMQQLQFHENKSFSVKENLSISPEEFEKGISKLKQFCVYLMELVRRKNGASVGNSGLQALTGTSTPASMPPLNAANLQQNQQAELMKTQAARQNSSQTQRNNNSRDNKAPAAPTSAQPPFSFLNGKPPHGVPVYGPNEFTQDTLKFPPTKRRKGNPGSAVSTPVQAHAVPASASSPKTSKMASPQVSRQAATPSKIKCQQADCASSKQEYVTPEELHHHHSEVHEAKEPVIEDPLAFFLESVRFGLGLDDNGKMKPKPKKGENEQSPAMKKSASTQGQTPLRQEGSTPMSRVSTQTRRPDSGASKGNKTADLKVTSGTSANPISKGPMTPPYDPWSDCPVSIAEVSALLPSLEDLHSSLSTASFTPPSTISSSKSDKNSPRPSDIGEGDNLKIRLNVADSWVAPGLYDDALFPPSDPTIEEDELLGMDWDTVFGRESTKKTDEWGGFNPNI